MSRTNGDRAENIRRHLEQIAGEVTPVAPHHWQVQLGSNGKSHALDARLTEQWLQLEAPLKPNGRRRKWDLLRRNHELEGLAKIGLLPGDKRLSLLAELPVENDIDLPALLAPTLAGFTGCFNGKATPGFADPATTEPLSPKELAARCRETGWPLEEKDDGSLLARLIVSGETFTAAIRSDGERGVRASAVVCACDQLPAKSRQALSWMLLRACGALNHARAVIADFPNEQSNACFEVRLTAAPSCTEIVHALSSLSVACSQFGREIRSAGEKNIASYYMKAH